MLTPHRSSDVLHPNKPNVSKDSLREKLSELYKVGKDQVSVFGFRTQYGGGKSTGFALIYDSNAALNKFEPHYRRVRIGMANKIEKASRQQSTPDRLQNLDEARDADNVEQGSSARTVARSCAVPRRPRVPRARRRNRRWALRRPGGLAWAFVVPSLFSCSTSPWNERHQLHEHKTGKQIRIRNVDARRSESSDCISTVLVWVLHLLCLAEATVYGWNEYR